MARFKFPFENVLKHRKILEDLAQKDFQEAQADLMKLRRELFAMHESIHGARSRAYEEQVAGGTASPSLTQIHEFIKGQDLRIERHMEKIKLAEHKVEEMREILRQKAIDYKIIEEHKEKKKSEFKVESNKKEQKEFDDLSSMRHRLKEK